MLYPSIIFWNFVISLINLYTLEDRSELKIGDELCSGSKLNFKWCCLQPSRNWQWYQRTNLFILGICGQAQRWMQRLLTLIASFRVWLWKLPIPVLKVDDTCPRGATATTILAALHVSSSDVGSTTHRSPICLQTSNESG